MPDAMVFSGARGVECRRAARLRGAGAVLFAGTAANSDWSALT